MTARLTILLLAATLAFLPACSEKNVTNNFAPDPTQLNQVYGRVTPPEAATEVSLWQALALRSTLTDAQGYFRLSDVPPGLYELRVLAPSGAHRRLIGVDVRPDAGVALGEIATSALPAPLFACEPSGDEVPTRFPYGPSPPVTLSSEAPLELESLPGGISVQPPVGNRWTIGPGYGDRLHVYRLEADSLLRTGTEYVVTIGPGLRTADGASWGRTYVHRFTTEPFRVKERTWTNSGDPGQPLPPDYRGTLLRCRYNDLIDPESLPGAVVLQPAGPLEIEVDRGHDLVIRVSRRLDVGAEFVLTVGPPLASTSGSVMDTTLRFPFRTDRFRLEARFLSELAGWLPPNVREHQLCVDSYNLPLDFESVRTGIRIAPECRYDIRHYSRNSYSIYLRGGLTPSTDYAVIIDARLASDDGISLGSEQTIPFRTADLQLEDVSFSDSPWGTDEIDPLDLLQARVIFNARVSQDSLDRASRFTPEIPGIWIASTQNEGELRYFLTEPTRLQAGTTYTLRIDGSVPLAGNAALGWDAVRSFTVNPVRLEGYSPYNGTTGVSTRSRVDLSFNAWMDRASVEAAFRLEVVDGDPVPGSFAWNEGSYVVSFQPIGRLRTTTIYRATLGATARDVDGHSIESGVTFVFRTGL